MKKLLLIFLLLASSLAGAQNYLTVTGSNTRGYGSALLPAGSLTFTATDSHGNPISYQAGGGGQVVRYPITCPIVNGAVSAGCQVANVSVSNPANFCYAVQIVDSANKIVLGGPQSGYQCVQPQTSNSWCNAGACDFDQLVPNIPTALTMLLPTPTPLSIGGVYAATCTAGLVSNGTLTTGLPSCVAGGGGGSSPGGLQGQLQYYAAGGVLGGISGWSTDGVDTLTGSNNSLVLNGTGISFQALGGASGTGGFFLGASGAEIFSFGTGNSLILGSASPAYNYNLSNEHLLSGVVNPSGNTTYVYGSPLQVGVNSGGSGVNSVSDGFNITSSGTSVVGPLNVPSGTTLTIQSGGTLACASGSTCPGVSVSGGSFTNNLPILGASGTAIKSDTANVVALTGFDINAANQVTGLRGAALPALSGSGYLNWTGTAWAFTNPFNNIVLTGTITTPLVGCLYGSGGGIVAGTGSACGSGGGGGSGTVSAGAAGQFPFYLASGTTVGPNTLLSDNGTIFAYTGSGGIDATQFGVTGSGAFVFGGTYGNFSPPGAGLSNCGFGSGGVFSCSFNNGPVTAMLQSGGVNGSDITAGTVAAARIGDLSTTYLLQSQVGQSGYAASLDNTGNVPQNQLGNVVIVGNNYVLTGYCQSNVGSTNVIYYLEPTSGSSSNNCASTTLGAEMPVPSAGTAKNLYVNAVNKGSNSSNVVLYVNGVATTLTCSIASAVTCNDTTHTVALAQGSTWSLRYAPGGTSDTAQGMRASFQVAVSAGYTESGWCPGAVGTASSIYVLLPSSPAFACTGTGATEVPITTSGTATNLYVNASAQGSHTSTVTLYINGVATALSCSIATAVTCNDSADQIPFNMGSTWSLRYTTGGTSDTAADIHAAFQVF
jgi:hypothetical protein